ncbi:MAG: thioredoxin domain-containing protein [Patescibacteria group bacterium]|nr:thioredoxin domain-containing protein [Patescibacteria group bacterium]
MLKKNKFNIKLFVIFSLLLFIFVVISMFFVLFRPYFVLTKRSEKNFENRYYFEENIDNNDPYINKVPNFADLLAGPIISESDPIRGNKEAEVAIVIFSDFVCSFCASQEKLINKALLEYDKKIMFIWKDYPETNKNSLSYRSALAGRCAQAQNRFWDYHDELYKTEKLEQDSFIRIAENLGLDKNKFNNCLKSVEADGLIQDNIEEANALDINGIPFMYVNKQEIFGQVNYDDLKRVIEVEIN